MIHPVNYPTLKRWASCFIDEACLSAGVSSPQALLPAIPAVALLSMLIAAFRSLSMLRPQEGQSCCLSDSSLWVRMPHLLHSFVVFSGSTSITLEPALSAL